VDNVKIALVTPVKNEIENLPSLINSIENQSLPISLWIIINDHSIDKSEDFLLMNIDTIVNVQKVFLLKPQIISTEYALGIKYSSLIDSGLKKIAEYEIKNSNTFDFIGILDADCSLSYNYYEKLIEKFVYLPKLGIASGTAYYLHNNKSILENSPRRCARGAARLWRKECLNDTGYIIGKSADTLTSAKAWLSGWQTQSFRDCHYYSRRVGTRYNATYLGISAYYCYLPLHFVLIKAVLFVFKFQFKQVKQYLLTYLNAPKTQESSRAPISLRKYFKSIIIRMFWENCIVIINILTIFVKKYFPNLIKAIKFSPKQP
jgi:glycosyltransferase involved in cell wall biosynthesis